MLQNLATPNSCPLAFAADGNPPVGDAEARREAAREWYYFQFDVIDDDVFGEIDAIEANDPDGLVRLHEMSMRKEAAAASSPSEIRRASSLASASAVPSVDGSAFHRRKAAPRNYPLHMYALDEYDRLERQGPTQDVDPLVAFIACATFSITMLATLGTLLVAFCYALGWI